MRRRAASCERSPTAARRSPVMPTSARNQGAPVPSTTRPPEMTRASPGPAAGTGPSRDALENAVGGASACRPATAPSATPPAASVSSTLFIAPPPSKDKGGAPPEGLLEVDGDADGGQPGEQRVAGDEDARVLELDVV